VTKSYCLILDNVDELIKSDPENFAASLNEMINMIHGFRIIITSRFFTDHIQNVKVKLLSGLNES
jgi:hypothetical protein